MERWQDETRKRLYERNPYIHCTVDSYLSGDNMAKVETKKISDLLPDPNNVNRHTQRGHGLVENSIRRRGVGRGILAAGKNTENPVIMAGNLTHEKARDAGIEEVIFVHTTGNQLVVTVRDDLDPTSPEAIALGIEDNESGKLSYNPDIDLLAAMSAGDNGVLSRLKEDDKIFGDMLAGMGVKDGEPVDAPPQIDRAAELAEKWQTKSGQLWKLGEHRLLIGDCTVRENVERLMGGERAKLSFQDPPYGYEYQSNMRTKSKKFEVLENDDKFIDFIPNIKLFSDGWSLVCTSWKVVREWIEICSGLGNLDNMIIWDKGGGGMGDLSHSLSTDYEIILAYGRGETIKGKRIGSVWGVNKDAAADYEHATQKPVELLAMALETFSLSGDIVADWFCGSGTTIIAAHNLKRRCYAMEISEKYGAIILERFYEATGITPELVTE